ncbi:MAG: hypothetical protein Q8M79_11005 [Dehalococcoidia bacterium]|nr:hypothetical protein [Dehalococcoidia bacterium]
MAASTTGSPASPFHAEIRLILTAALALFAYTVVVGILNGLDLVDFEHKILLAHVHIGTLGWITMAVFAGSLALFGTSENRTPWLIWTARLAPLVAALYNVAFMTTTSVVRPVLGTAMAIVIVLMAVWGFSQARGRTLSVPHLGLLAGLATSILGAGLGVLLGLRASSPDLNITERVGEAHPATMVIGFLVPVGMAFAEWVMRPESANERASRLGWLQIGLPFIGGIAVMLGILLDVLALVMLSLPFEIAGLAIFLWRIIPVARRVSWTAPSAERHGVVAAIFLTANITIFVYLISNYAEDFDATPLRLLLALDHSIFVGVLTMSVVGFISTVNRTPRPPVIDHAVFGGITLGAALFITGLLADQDVLIRTGTPLLGAGLLLAIAVHIAGLLSGRGSAPAR